MKQAIFRYIEVALVGCTVFLLVMVTLGAILEWDFNQYMAYSFFISWGVLFLFYIITLHNQYSLIVFGLMAGALGIYYLLTGHEMAETGVLISKISLAVFVALLGVKLYKMRNEIQEHSMLYLIMLVLLALQIVIQDYRQLEPLSLTGFSNYFAVGIIAHILLNEDINYIFSRGERKILLLQAIFCLYSISLMMISNFNYG